MNSKTDVFLKPRIQVSYIKIKDVLHPLYEGLNFIGRRKDATVVIENQNVSQYHAVITITDDKHFLSDTGSFNGSFLDKEKLQPLLLYELSEGSVIHFACITGIYVKTPSTSQAVVAPNRKAAQNFSESFFVANTQQLEVENPEEVFNNCFDDDYDFNSVATQDVTTVVSIHDMPTQIFSSSDLEKIENSTPLKTGLLSIHDMSTQIDDYHTKASSIHEMPTQMILNDSDVQNEVSVTSADIHDLPTQFIDLENAINSISNKKSKEIDIHELRTQINSADKISTQEPQQHNVEIEICSEVNEKIPEQSSLINSDKNDDILCQPSTSKCFDNNADAIIGNDGDHVVGSPEPRLSVANISDDIIEDSFLGNLIQEDGDKQEYLSLKSISKLTNSEPISSTPPLQISQPVGFSANKKKCQAIVYSSTPSSSEKENSEDIIVAGQTKICLRINSDSDTDVSEDLLAAANSEIIKNDTKTDKLDDSGSATDIGNNFNPIEGTTTKKVLRKRKTIQKIDSDSDTDIEDVPKTSTRSPNKLSVKKINKGCNVTNSDSETDMEENKTQAVSLGSKITNVREEQDSDVIPCTQLSDDDINDFNFGIENNSTMVEKNNMDDISENFSLRFSSYTELSEETNKQLENHSKKIDVSPSQINVNVCANSSNNKNKVHTIEEIQLLTTESTLQPSLVSTSPRTLISDDLFAQPTQKIISDENDSLFIQPTQPMNLKNKSADVFVPLAQKSSLGLNHLFDQPTQQVIVDEQCDDVFMQPTQKLVQTSKGEAENLVSYPTRPAQKVGSSSENVFDQPTQQLIVDEQCDDDVFMQPTQKLVQTSKGDVENLTSCPIPHAQKGASSSKSLFDQPTQPLLSDENDDNLLFMQPTQKMVPTSKDENEECDDLFMQPTQKVIETSNGGTESENLFSCPTQPVQKTRSSSKNLLHQPLVRNKNCEDDLFMQPTQKLALNSKSQIENENLFDQPTQPMSLDDKMSDLFLQPTQEITCNSKDGEDKTLLDQPTQAINIGVDCDDLFMQPTQKVSQNLFDTPTQPITFIENNGDDLFLQPSKKVASTSDNEKNQNLFDQPTQPLTSEKHLNDDLFLQPTQELPNKVTLKNKSPLKMVPDGSEKGTSVESQLEVMFASQPFLPQSNSRPSNPLVSVLEGKHTHDSQDTMSGNFPAIESLEVPDVDQDKVTVKENLSSKQDEVTTKKQTRSREKVVVKENITSNEEKSNRQLRRAREITLTDAKVDDTKILTRGSKRSDSVKISEKIEEQEVKVKKQNQKKKDGSSERSQQSNEDEDEINKKSIGNEKLKTQDKKQSKGKDGGSSQETKINTRKRSTRSDSVDSLDNAKTIKKNKPSDKNETCNQTDMIKSSSRLRNLKKEPNKIIEVQENINSPVRKSSRTINTGDVAGTSKKVVKSKTLKPSTLIQDGNAIKESVVLTVVRSTRGSKKNSKSEQQPLAKTNESIISISSDNSDDDIILNKPRINKRRQESQSSSPSPKKLKSSDTSPKIAPIAKRSRRLLSKADSVEEPVKQKRSNESVTSDSSASNQSLLTPIKNRRLSNLSSFSDSPNRNKRKQKPKVVFTMLDSPELESLIRSLGGTIVDTVNACTVLVTGSLKRSKKLLSAVGQAKPICSEKWLHECKKKSTFLDPWDFILEDDEAETKWNFSLKESLNRSQNQKLLANYFFLVLATTAVDVLKAAIESCGGKCVSRAPSDTKNFIVVATPENKSKYSKFIKQNITIVAPEAIFDGVLRQELHFKDHLLS